MSRQAAETDAHEGDPFRIDSVEREGEVDNLSDSFFPIWTERQALAMQGNQYDN